MLLSLIHILITLIDPDAPASEAYRTLRTNILMRNFDRDMKIINIISTTAQEGKSTCVLNLAMVYAQLQKKVLVIDLDLRMPTIHKKLKLKNKKGISDIIGHQAEFEEVVLQPYENVEDVYKRQVGMDPQRPGVDAERFAAAVDRIPLVSEGAAGQQRNRAVKAGIGCGL